MVLLMLMVLAEAAQPPAAPARPAGGRPGECVNQPGEAEIRTLRGAALHKEMRLAEALVDLECAVRLATTPRNLALLGLAELSAEHWVNAERDLQAAMARASDPYIEKNYATLNSGLTLVKSHLGFIELVKGPAGAQVKIAGEAVGSLPFAAPIRVAAGLVSVEVESADHAQTMKVDASVKAGESFILQLAMPSVPPRTPLVIITPPPPPPPAPSSRSASVTLGWTAVAAAVVSLGVGIAFQVDRERLAADFNTPGNGCGMAYTNNGGSGCQGKHADVVRAQWIAVGGYAGAAVLSGIGLFLLWPAEQRPSRLACAPTNAHALGCSFVF